MGRANHNKRITAFQISGEGNKRRTPPNHMHSTRIFLVFSRSLNWSSPTLPQQAAHQAAANNVSTPGWPIEILFLKPKHSTKTLFLFTFSLGNLAFTWVGNWKLINALYILYRPSKQKSKHCRLWDFANSTAGPNSCVHNDEPCLGCFDLLVTASRRLPGPNHQHASRLILSAWACTKEKNDDNVAESIACIFMFASFMPFW